MQHHCNAANAGWGGAETKPDIAWPYLARQVTD